MSDSDLNKIISEIDKASNKDLDKQREVERLYDIVDKQKKTITDLELRLKQELDRPSIGPAGQAGMDAVKQHLDQMHAEIDRKDALIEAQINEITGVRKELDTARTQLTQLTRSGNSISEELATLRAAHAAKELELRNKIAELQARNEELDHVKQAQANPEAGHVKLLEQQVETLQSAVRGTQAQIQTLEASLKDSLGQVADLEARLRSRDADAQQLEMINKECEDRIKELETAAASASGSEVVETLKGELAAQDFDLRMQAERVSELEARLAGAQERESAARTLSIRQAELETQMRGLQEKLDGARQELLKHEEISLRQAEKIKQLQSTPLVAAGGAEPKAISPLERRTIQ